MKKSLLIKLIVLVLTACILLFFTPIIKAHFSYKKIERIVIDDFKKRFTHGIIEKRYRSKGNKESFYFYVNYKEGDIIYNAEYLCQNINKKWEYYFIKTSVFTERINK